MKKKQHRKMKLSDEWRTPPDLFAALNKEFNFGIDLCATANNKLLPHAICHPMEDVLSITKWQWEQWGTSGIAAYMNPPYSNPGPFLRRAAEISTWGSDAVFFHYCVVALVKCDPSTKWWAEACATASELRLLTRRVKYLKPDGAPTGAPNFPSAIFVWRPGVKGLVIRHWDWK